MKQYSTALILLLVICLMVPGIACGGGGDQSATTAEELLPEKGLPAGVEHQETAILSAADSAAPQGVTEYNSVAGATYTCDGATIEMSAITCDFEQDAEAVLQETLQALPTDLVSESSISFNGHEAIKLSSNSAQFCMILWRTGTNVFVVSGEAPEEKVIEVAQATGY
jgi:hypothetical protein